MDRLNESVVAGSTRRISDTNRQSMASKAQVSMNVTDNPRSRSTWFSRYILPGFILKAAVIGGGYVSGRELEQYFAGHGPLGGLLGMLIAMTIWSVMYAVTLEFARVHRSYDYRTFFKNLLGPFWIVFELAYLLAIFTVLSVLTSVAGNTLEKVTGWPVLLCEAGFMAAVAFVLFFGTRVVERFLSLWSFVLYAAFAALVILSLAHFGDRIIEHIQAARVEDFGGVAWQGVKYASYNISAIPAVLFCARHIQNRKDALIGGLLGGPLAMIPGMFFFLAMSAWEPAIRGQAVPVEFLLDKLDNPTFRLIFLAVMAITLVGTCSALIHAVNERVAQTLAAANRPFHGWMRAAIAAVTMVLSVSVAVSIGLVALVDKGYSLLAWVFIVVFMIPMLTYGLWKLARMPADNI
jgi:uncharacterized membrane protein YkvI